MNTCNCFNKLLSHNRKTLYIILGIVMISVLTLTIVYAALSTTLNINGNAEVSSASWDVHLDNVQLNSRSATTAAPTITNKTTASFSTTLSKPGDFYEFTIDVVNNGTIDAMIDSVTKTPELTDTQKKYLNYIVEYQNGESITTKQLVAKNSFVRLRIKIGFRTDILSSDIPESAETLNLSFKVNYVQSDDNNENITIDNNGKLIKIVSGNYNTVGSEICIGEECFYVMSSDDNSVTMLAKYNLHVTNVIEDTSYIAKPLENSTGIQNENALGAKFDSNGVTGFPWYGTMEYSLTNYWWDNTNNNFKSGYSTDFELDGTLFPYIYSSESALYGLIENYKRYLENTGISVEEARLIKASELISLGCNSELTSCKTAPSWVYGTSYWTGTAYTKERIFNASTTGGIAKGEYDNNYAIGVRPVIKIAL